MKESPNQLSHPSKKDLEKRRGCYEFNVKCSPMTQAQVLNTVSLVQRLWNLQGVGHSWWKLGSMGWPSELIDWPLVLTPFFLLLVSHDVNNSPPSHDVITGAQVPPAPSPHHRLKFLKP